MNLSSSSALSGIWKTAENDWKNIEQLAIGDDFIVGFAKDGTIRYLGSVSINAVSNWVLKTNP